ncbi:MAG: hypothetical protein ACFHXK_16630 [bacterium]
MVVADYPSIERIALKLKPGTWNEVPGQQQKLAQIDAKWGGVQLVFLGETNHFVHEKVDFRLWWLRRLAQGRRLVIGEELGWSDGRRIAAYLSDGDLSHLHAVATFGFKGHLRTDRNDSPTGVFADSLHRYPYALMGAEHTRFYQALRELQAVDDYFGFDVDSPPGGAYKDIERRRPALDQAGMPEDFWGGLQRVQGETLDEEVHRLRHLMGVFAGAPGFELIREDLLSLTESLEYTALFKDATDYEATRPAMAFREQTMKRRLDDVLQHTDSNTLVVLMGHAFHLAKNDHLMLEQSIGPGGGEVSSLGHYLVQERGLEASSIWMVYAAGEDSQPICDLPRRADYPDHTINAALSVYDFPIVLPVDVNSPFMEPVSVGQMYNLVTQVHLPAQVDYVMYLPRVSPLIMG